LYEDLKSLNGQSLFTPEVKELIAWAKDLLRGPCPHCCSGVTDTGDPETSEYGLCPHCKGDSRQ
jgi:hypothetical protein